MSNAIITQTETSIDCWCDRGKVAVHLLVCEACLRDRALAFWQLMGLSEIPGDAARGTLAVLPSMQTQPAPRRHRRARR